MASLASTHHQLLLKRSRLGHHSHPIRMDSKDGNQVDLHRLARQSMLAHGFQPDFGPAVLEELTELKAHPPALIPDSGVRDLRHLLWSSIDNDSSRDLDQI